MNVRNLAFGIDFKGLDTGPLRKIDAGMDSVKKSMESTIEKSKKLKINFDEMGSSMQKMGGKLTKGVTLPLVGLATAGTKMYMDLETGIKKVSTLADTDILPVDRIEKEIRAISDATGIAQTEIAESVYGALSAGVDTVDVMDFVRSGVDLTKAGFTDMNTAIDATTTVLNAYGKDAFDTSKIHDIFVKTQDKGKISVDELGNSLGRVVPTASSLGVNLDELGASYAILTAKGQNAELATTNLNAMLGELGKTGSESDKMIRELSGKSFKQLIAEGKNTGEVLEMLESGAKNAGLSLNDMFGSKSAAAAATTLLSDGVEHYTDVLGEMNDAEGLTAKNAESMEGGMYAIQKAVTQAKNALIDFGGMVAPHVEKVADLVSGAVEKFSNLDDGTKQLIGKALLMAMALGPVLSIGGKLMSGISGIPGKIETAKSAFGVMKGALGLLASPIGITVALIAGIGIALVVAYNKSETFRNIVNGAFNKVKEVCGIVVEKVKSGWESVTAVFDKVSEKVSSATETIKAKWEGLRSFMKNPIKGTVEIAQKGASWVANKFRKPHKDGAYNIPYDNYPADLHKGEMVLTAEASNRFRSMGGTEKTVPTISTTTSKSSDRTNATFSPSISINVNGNADSDVISDLEARIKRIVSNEQDKFWSKLALQQ